MSEEYKGYKIIAIEDDTGFSWMISGENFFMCDNRTINGEKFQSLKHAMNQAKIFLAFKKIKNG